MISVLMPVKNAGRYLAACLQSILDQTNIDWELIAVNDHSEDHSAEILEKYAFLDSRIKWFNNNGRGIIDSLRLAYSKSQGELLTRMDADDLMPIQKLERMQNELINAGEGHLVTAYVDYFSADELGQGYQDYAQWLNSLTEQENNFQEIYKECVIPSPCWMVFKSDFERCGAFRSHRYPEDYDLCFRFKEARLRVRAVKEVLHLWRDHTDRASRNDPNYIDNRFIDLKMYHYLKSDYDATLTLIVWGAGKKAKAIAKYLIHNSITFRWVCNNPNKIGKNIYGHIIETTEIISDCKPGDCLVAVANKIDQSEIKNKLELNPGIRAVFMC